MHNIPLCSPLRYPFVSGTAASIGEGTTFQFHTGDGTAIADLDVALAADFSLALSSTLTLACVVIDATSVTLSHDKAADCDTPALSFEAHPTAQGIRKSF